MHPASPSPGTPSAAPTVPGTRSQPADDVIRICIYNWIGFCEPHQETNDLSIIRPTQQGSVDNPSRTYGCENLVLPTVKRSESWQKAAN